MADSQQNNDPGREPRSIRATWRDKLSDLNFVKETLLFTPDYPVIKIASRTILFIPTPKELAQMLGMVLWPILVILLWMTTPSDLFALIWGKLKIIGSALLRAAKYLFNLASMALRGLLRLVMRGLKLLGEFRAIKFFVNLISKGLKFCADLINLMNAWLKRLAMIGLFDGFYANAATRKAKQSSRTLKKIELYTNLAKYLNGLLGAIKTRIDTTNVEFGVLIEKTTSPKIRELIENRRRATVNHLNRRIDDIMKRIANVQDEFRDLMQITDSQSRVFSGLAAKAAELRESLQLVRTFVVRPAATATAAPPQQRIPTANQEQRNQEPHADELMFSNPNNSSNARAAASPAAQTGARPRSASVHEDLPPPSAPPPDLAEDSGMGTGLLGQGGTQQSANVTASPVRPPNPTKPTKPYSSSAASRGRPLPGLPARPSEAQGTTVPGQQQGAPAPQQPTRRLTHSEELAARLAKRRDNLDKPKS